jgi:hypothetical protein
MCCPGRGRGEKSPKIISRILLMTPKLNQKINCKIFLTNKELHDTVESNMLVVAMQEHVGNEPPNFPSPVRVVNKVGAEQPF